MEEFSKFERRVYGWAVVHRHDDVHYGSRASWWRAALDEGVCTMDEYEEARRVYGTLWDYRGD
jgi:hypothetical protein